MDKRYSKLSGLFLFTCLLTPASAQVNTYFENNPIWQVSSSCAAPAPCIRYDTYNYYVNGDTLINGTTYIKIFKNGTYYYNWFSPNPIPPGCAGWFSYSDTVPLHLLRSDNKQIYILNSGVDELLYDFDLAVGDTLPLTYNNFDPLITVTAIDSLFTPYGYRKKFELAGSGSTATELLEGIGSHRGFIEPIHGILECGYGLMCYSLNDTAWYPASGPTCELNMGLAGNAKADVISVYPNPFNEQTTISWPGSSAMEWIAIYDSKGRKIRTEANIQDSPYQMQRGKLPAGIYFIELHSKDGYVVEKKLVIID